MSKGKRLFVYNSQTNYPRKFAEIDVYFQATEPNIKPKHLVGNNALFIKAFTHKNFEQNLHHFFKDFAVDIFSVSKRLDFTSNVTNR